MNKKSIIYLILTTIFFVFLGLYLQKEQSQTYQQTQTGRFLFEKTNQKGTQIGKIIVKSQNMQVTLSVQNKFWRVKEADDYFADILSVNMLIHGINTSKIAMVYDKEPPQDSKNEFEISTYDTKNQLLDSIVIGKKINNYYYAQEKSTKKSYMVSGTFALSNQLRHWLQQPLLSLLEKNIQTVILVSKTGQQLAFKPEGMQNFYNTYQQKTNIVSFLDKFVNFTYLNVKNISNTPLKDVEKNRTIIIYTDTGIIYKIALYKIEDDYWIEPEMQISKLPLKAGYSYYKDSKILYNGWAFKIDQQLGSFLNTYNIR